MRRQRGATLIELMIGAAIAAVVGLAAAGLYTISQGMHRHGTNQNESVAGVREAVDAIRDDLSMAIPLSGSSQILTAASATSVTFAVPSTNGPVEVTYSLSGNNVVKTSKVLSTNKSTSTVVLKDAKGLKFTYYVASSATTNSGAEADGVTGYNAFWWNTTANPNIPSNTERPKVIAVQVEVQAVKEGYPATYTSIGRIRNRVAS